MFTSKQIRSSFIEFFKDKGHKFVPSAPVVPTNDATLLFTNAGMNQFKDIFLGLTEPECSRAANSQKCIRVSGKHNDLEEVGLDTYHHTFFEMLGNWSFGDYFKEEAIAWAWQLLTEVYGIDESKLWATVFAGDPDDGSEPDEEAEQLWAKLTPLPKDRVLRFGKKDNFWEMGDTGPCGPCSEIHIDLGPERCDKQHIPGHKCAVNAGCARFIELWNLVFIQFNRQPDGTLVPLKAKYVDTGAGLERLAALLQGKKSNYDTDLFMPIIEAVQDVTGHKYGSSLESKTDNAFRVISDHIRSLTFSITDGVAPSNEGRGYVMRRILRRASRFARVLDAHEPFMYKLVDVIVENMGDAFPELRDRQQFVKTVIKAEEESFGRTLDRGLEIFASAADDAEKAGSKILSGENAFQLYDTYGFPLDLTQLMARERGLEVDTGKFDELMEQQRARARAAQKTSSLAMDLSGVALPVTEDESKYDRDTVETTIVGWINKDGYKEAGVYSEIDESVAIVLKDTCFYAEAGGQVGDAGVIVGPEGRFQVETTEKIANCVIHKGTLVSGSISVGDKVTATVDHNRNESKKNHTATHLLQWALQKTLGKDVQQQGSLVCPEYLRFDFTWPKALTADEIKQVESLVTENIVKAYPVGCEVLPIDKARELGAMALFSEKYGDEVRVVGVGVEGATDLANAFSLEFCGGTHVTNTSQIGGFKIVKEESISAGVRRITAMTGHALNEYLSERSDLVDELTAMLKAPAEQITARVAKLLEDNKKLAKDLKNAAKKGGTDVVAVAGDMLSKADKIGDTAIVVGSLDSATVDQARQAVDSLKKKSDSVAILFGIKEDDSKAILLAAMTDDLVKKGLKAGDLVREVAPLIKGGGGGRPQMAQAGGKDPSGLENAYAKAKDFIGEKLK